MPEGNAKRARRETRPVQTRRSLQSALDTAERERQMLAALCANYTAAYHCDLVRDYMEPIKQKSFSHCAREEGNLSDRHSYSQWVRHAYETFVVRDTAQDYLEVFDARNIMERLRTQESFVYRHRTLPNAAGMEYFEATVVRLYEGEGTFQIILGYRPIDDLVAEEKARQERMEQALRAAERANRAKTDFLRRMSHDIRTPLNGLIGLLDIDEGHFDDLDLVRANHEKMRVAADHLLSLINDVLQMSKLEDGTVEFAHEPIALAEMTRDIVTIVVDRAVSAGLQWNYERGKVAIPYPYIYGSPLHLRQIFLNIYGNCIKYNRPGGSITTVVEALGEKDGVCTYRWTISDTGVGMSPAFLEHIFEPFAQERTDARSIYNGTGLGMAIVKSLVEQMGGTITVTSREGVGSTFVIVLPFEIAPAPAQEARAVPESGSIRGLRLLLAEDNELNAEIAQRLLADRGAEVTLVPDGAQAVARFRDEPPGRFDAILMDMMMPVMDGLEATRAIRAIPRADAKNIPILAMTANAFQEDAQECLNAGMNAHLAKPLDMNKLTSTLAALCRGGNGAPRE